MLTSANAAFRRAQAEAGGRPLSPERLDQILQAYAGVLKNSGFDREAAYNYEYLARLRDAGRARKAGNDEAAERRPRASSWLRASGPAGRSARWADDSRPSRHASTRDARRRVRSADADGLRRPEDAARADARRQAAEEGMTSLTFGAPRYLPLLIVPAALLVGVALAARCAAPRPSPFASAPHCSRPRAVWRVRGTALLGRATRRGRAPHRGGRPATGTLVHPAPRRARSRGPAGRVGVDARQ